MKSKLLSKSKYLNGLQCLRYLWLLFNEPAKIPAPDASTQHIFDEGHRVGELAKRLFPNGINIPINDFTENLARTKELIKSCKPLFEPGFFVDDIYSRLDILKPVGNDEWDMVEVKGSTSVKDVNVHDVSFQRLCAERFGLKIRKCFIAHINNQYVKLGEIEPEKLFTTEDITVAVNDASIGIQGRIDAMFEIISSSECPDVSIGSHCNQPYACPVASCWESLPEHHVFQLYRGGRKCSELFSQGILRVKDIPKGFKLSEPQRIQKDCVISGTPHINKIAIKDFLGRLQYPLHYFDFETISPMLPIYEGTRPFQRIPFQFSLHLVGQANSKPVHYSFLAEGSDDPRLKLLSVLKGVFKDSGSVVVYNQSFEKSVLQELGEAFPRFRGFVDDLCGRLVDLYTPFREFNYYHPIQKGSASIKEVLPAVTGKSYKGMPIANGDDASLAFLRLVCDDISDEGRARLRADLERYCGLDTEGMLLIVDRLRALSSQ